MSKIKMKLMRDSVCMADDVNDHTRIINIIPPSEQDTNAFMIQIAKNYLPTMNGYGHTWDCMLNGEKIAVISGNCEISTPTFAAPVISDGSCMYFKYHSAAY